jgi:hypothetical protein
MNSTLMKDILYMEIDVNCSSCVSADHASGGPYDIAEHNIVDPVGTGICNNASSQSPDWPACSCCPF